MTKLFFTTVDVFTTTRYQGNPLAIVRVPASLKTSLTQDQKQAIAKEFNLSETVFLHIPAEGDTTKSRHVEIYTPYAELPFAGHPTIGTTYYLLKTTQPESDSSVDTLITKAGPIPLSTLGSKVKALIPQNYHEHKKTFETPLNPGKQNALVSIVKGVSFIYTELPDLATLAKVTLADNLAGDSYESIGNLDEGWQTGLIGTMYYVKIGKENGEWHYRTRMIAFNEDPGTGSASAGLGSYLALKEGTEGKERVVFEQGVELGRRNEITVEVEYKGGNVVNVWLSGEAAVVIEGSLEL